MKKLCNKENIKKWFDKAVKVLIRIISFALFLVALIIPFIQAKGIWFEVFKWAWIVSIVLNLYLFSNYKKAREQKIFIPIFSFFATLTLFYLCNYWNLVSMCVAIVCSIVIGLLEFGITVKLYRTVRFTEKQELKFLPSKATDGILLGSVYASSIALFILGHYLNQTMVFIFGIIAMIMLFSSVISVVSKGFKASNSILSTICVILDIVSVLALIGYLIYLTPNDDSLQDIVLSLTSAVIGGALTLAGVAWTIRKADIDRNEIERKQYKPFFVLLNVYDKKNDKDVTRIDFEATNDKGMFGLLDGYIQNLDFSHFIIEKIVIADTEYYPITNSVIEKNEIISLSVYGSKKEVQSAMLYISDVLGYKYIYNMILETETPEHRCKCVEKCTLIREEKQ